MKLTKSILFRAIVILTLPTFAQSPTAKPVPTVTYTDDTTRVSFTYPLAWKRVDKVNSYLAAPSLDPETTSGFPGLKARATVQFSPEGNVYGHTNLSGLAFIYQTIPITPQTPCGNNLVKDIAQDEPSSTQINGVAFRQANVGDVAMCHASDAHLYWTAKAGTCHLFETAFLTLCPNNGDGHRTLTNRESRALDRHLHKIVESIRIP